MEILNLNRMNDVLFKAVFGQNPDITLDFINSVFAYQGTSTFKSVDFIDRELDPMEEDGKESRLDLLGRDAFTGEKVNLEVQVIKQKYFGERSLYYWARLYDDLKRGGDYENLTRTVTINVLDFNLFDEETDSSDWHSCFGVYDIKSGKRLTDDLEMHFIELPKWSIQKNIKDMNAFECWVSYFDKKTTAKDLEAIAMQEPMIKEAIRTESIFTQDEIKRRAYELKEKAERDYRGHIMYYKEMGFNEGRNTGFNEGKNEGMKKLEKLIKTLIDNGKAEDINAVVTNEDLRNQMFSKYHIE